jgi:hypothetical protein
MAIINPDRSIFIPPVIDFQNHGIRCETISIDGNATDLDGKYHAIICWTTKPFDNGKLKSFTGLQQAPLNSAGTGTVDAKNTPVIIFRPDAGSTDPSSGCIAMNNRFDLRLLEAQMGDLLSSESAHKEAVQAGRSK